MMDKNVIIIVTYIYTSILFSNNRILWDLGVIIDSTKSTNSFNENSTNNKIKMNAIISDPFIAPTRKNNSKINKQKKYNSEFININFTTNISQNILKIKRLFFSKQYKKIVDILNNNNLNNIPIAYRNDLQYYFAYSMYKIGDYDSAIKQVNNLIEKENFEKHYILLTMIYESMDNKMLAKQYYKKIITLYPNSEYVSSAKIKLRMLTNN